MRKSALEKLSERGMVVIIKKKNEWLVECVRKDEYGFLTGRTCVWGESLEKALAELEEKVQARHN